MNVLDQLLAASRVRARRDARLVPLRELRREVASMPPARRFEAAIRYGDRLAVIAEVKRASPSGGSFDRAADVRALAQAYRAGGATAISILTEPTRFGGSDHDLREVAGLGLPVLRKDFTVSAYQVWQARAIGADAVLLIARALPGEELARLLAAAAEAGLDALVEVHDDSELERALATDATFIGVNARDLATLEVDIERGLRLLEQARQSGATLIAESGLASAEDLQRVGAAGARGALVGTSLLRSGDPAAATLKLASGAPLLAVTPIPAAPLRAEVKVCGMRSEAAVRAAVAAGADMAGFVVASGARRAVAPVRVAELGRHLNGGPQPVLVFRRPTRAEVDEAIAGSGISNVQISGFDEPPAWLAELSAGTERIGVIHATGAVREALTSAEAWYAAGATRVLLEGASAVDGGGSGRAAPLSMARRLNRILPLGVAGGLTPANVARVVRTARPAYVDASTGLERAGQSEPKRIRAFVRNARRDPMRADRVDGRGRFGRFGGRYVPETLIPALDELTVAWTRARRDKVYLTELRRLHRDFIGRPTPIFEIPAQALAERGGIGQRIFLKREDLAHTGAHKINNAIGQALLARQMGKPRVIAETGAGQHGVAAATACALLGMECVVYMGTTDIERQAPNVQRMHLLGAEVRPVATGNGTLRDALNEALRDWVANVESTFYILGSAAGPHPYPDMVAELQSVVGRESRAQMLERIGRAPDAVIACVGGGSNAIGIMRPFLDTGARLIGVEAGGRSDALGDNAASLGLGSPGVLHGALTMLTQTSAGQVVEPHSVSAGLDYPGVGPQLAALAASGRLEAQRATDAEALEATVWLSRRCGIVPALESAHALSAALRLLPSLPAAAVLLVNLSGRGDKDLEIVARELPAALAAVAS
jgi:tryptophan synthase beta subunit